MEYSVRRHHPYVALRGNNCRLQSPEALRDGSCIKLTNFRGKKLRNKSILVSAFPRISNGVYDTPVVKRSGVYKKIPVARALTLQRCPTSLRCNPEERGQTMIHIVNLLIISTVVGGMVFWFGIWRAEDVDYNLRELNATEVFISAEKLQKLMESPKGVTVLDARNKYNAIVARIKPLAGTSIDGSHRAPWGSFTTTGGRGPLKSINDLEAQFRSLSVSNGIPVVVYGSWKEEWGEEGRVYWQLDWLGHKKVYILYGGIFAWADGGFKGKGVQGEGDFVADPVDSRISDADEIAQLIDDGADDLLLLDSRKESEYKGSLEFNVARGGHIPGAVSYHWKNVFEDDGSGNLKQKESLRAELEALGFRDGMKVAAYCTGGIRSGFLYAILKWLGYSGISNYPGSWWDWASRTDLPVSTFTGFS